MVDPAIYTQHLQFSCYSRLLNGLTRTPTFTLILLCWDFLLCRLSCYIFEFYHILVSTLLNYSKSTNGIMGIVEIIGFGKCHRICIKSLTGPKRFFLT